MANGFSCSALRTLLPRLLKKWLSSAASVRYKGDALSSELNLHSIHAQMSTQACTGIYQLRGCCQIQQQGAIPSIEPVQHVCTPELTGLKAVRLETPEREECVSSGGSKL